MDGCWGDFVFLCPEHQPDSQGSESGNLWHFFEHGIVIRRVVDLVECPSMLGVRQAGELTIGYGVVVPAVPRPNGARVRRHRTALLKHRDTPRYTPRYTTLHTVLHHVTSHNVTHRGTPRYTPRYTTLHTMLHHVTSHHVTHRVTSRYTPCYTTLHIVIDHVTS